MATSWRSWVSSHWSTIKIVGVSVGGILAAGVAVSQLIVYSPEPHIEWTWYQEKGSTKSPTETPGLVIDGKDIANGEAKLPIQLAFRNTGSKTAHSVRVELSYPKEAKIISSSNTSISADNKFLV